MSYTIHDTSTSSRATCHQLSDAISKVDAVLKEEERWGRRVLREAEGRWAIYDGTDIEMVWIEADNGSIISFAR